MKPLIYFSYSITKAGSTMAFHLARSALELAGYPQPRFDLKAIDAKKKINFVQNISQDQADEMLRLVDDLGYPIALKSHNRPNPSVVKMVQSGHALAHAVYRDPRDVALSMMDHGAKSRAKGSIAFAEIETLEDAIKGIRNQCDSLTAWLRLPGTLPLCYDDVAFDTIKTAQRILDQLQITGDAEQIAHVVLNNRFTQFNKGIQQRYLRDMDKSDAKAISVEFAPLLNKFIKNRHKLPMDGRIQLPPPDQLRTTASE